MEEQETPDKRNISSGGEVRVVTEQTPPPEQIYVEMSCIRTEGNL